MQAIEAKVKIQGIRLKNIEARVKIKKKSKNIEIGIEKYEMKKKQHGETWVKAKEYSWWNDKENGIGDQ